MPGTALPAFSAILMSRLFRRRLKPTRLPHPVLDAHTEAFFSGIAIGFVLAAALAVIFVHR
jgi:hypothetical protein